MRSVVELDCTLVVAVMHSRRVAVASLLLTGVIWRRICLIRVPPKSLLLLHRIVINKVIKISGVCTLIIWPSMLTFPSRWRKLCINIDFSKMTYQWRKILKAIITCIIFT